MYNIVYGNYIMNNKLTLVTKEIELKKTEESIKKIELET
jgi:hypothetical protein